MATFTYRACKSDGRVIKGQIEAETKEKVINNLKESNLIPIEVKEIGIMQRDLDFTFMSGVKAKDLSLLCKQFSSLLAAGVTVIGSLDILKQQTSNKQLLKALNTIYDEVQKGTTFSKCIEQFSDIFPPIMLHMIEAGELSGNLETAFSRLADHFERDNKIATKVKGALTYPIVVIIFAIVSVNVIVLFVMPGFKDIFDQLGADLPFLTKMLLAFSDFMIKYWYLIIIGIFGIISAYILYARTKKGRYNIDKLLLKIPYVGNLNLKVASSRFARTLSSMLTSGLSLFVSLDVTGRVIGNTFIQDGLQTVREKVSQGSSMSEPIRELEIFPPMITHMLSVGESTGEVENLLESTASFYDDEVDLAVSQLTAIMEPMIILILGVVVLIIVLAVFQPILSLYENLSNM